MDPGVNRCLNTMGETAMRRMLLACALFAPLAANAACPDDAAVARLAAALTSGQPAEPFPGLSMADAECARDKLVPLLAPAFGAPVGYKVGLATPAAQQRFGVTGPVWGVIFASTIAAKSGATIALTPQVAGLGVEADLLVRVKDAGINTAGQDPVAILRHLDQVIPFIELPRGGIAGKVDGPILVSANVSARLGVVGEPIAVAATPEFAARLASMTVTFTDNDKEVARAAGSALLGHPLNAVTYLVGDLARTGKALKAGDIVSLGGFAPSVPAQAGHAYAQRYEGLTAQPVTVEVRFQ